MREDIKEYIDCGSLEFWERWWNARELERPRIVSELALGIEGVLTAKTKRERELLLKGVFWSISRCFEDAVNFGRNVTLTKVEHLIKEIEREIKSCYNTRKEFNSEDWYRDYLNGEIKGLQFALTLIKKQFKDVSERGGKDV